MFKIFETLPSAIERHVLFSMYFFVKSKWHESIQVVFLNGYFKIIFKLSVFTPLLSHMPLSKPHLIFVPTAGL